jgi:hypothetical protein
MFGYESDGFPRVGYFIGSLAKGSINRKPRQLMRMGKRDESFNPLFVLIVESLVRFFRA